MASCNLDGLSEQQIKQKYQQETVPSRQYKPRRRRTLSLSEQEDIVKEYFEGYVQQKEIARRHRVTV